MDTNRVRLSRKRKRNIKVIYRESPYHISTFSDSRRKEQAKLFYRVHNHLAYCPSVCQAAVRLACMRQPGSGSHVVHHAAPCSTHMSLSNCDPVTQPHFCLAQILHWHANFVVKFSLESIFLLAFLIIVGSSAVCIMWWFPILQVISEHLLVVEMTGLCQS